MVVRCSPRPHGRTSLADCTQAERQHDEECPATVSTIRPRRPFSCGRRRGSVRLRHDVRLSSATDTEPLLIDDCTSQGRKSRRPFTGRPFRRSRVGARRERFDAALSSPNRRWVNPHVDLVWVVVVGSCGGKAVPEASRIDGSPVSGRRRHRDPLDAKVESVYTHWSSRKRLPERPSGSGVRRCARGCSCRRTSAHRPRRRRCARPRGSRTKLG